MDSEKSPLYATDGDMVGLNKLDFRIKTEIFGWVFIRQDHGNCCVWRHPKSPGMTQKAFLEPYSSDFRYCMDVINCFVSRYGCEIFRVASQYHTKYKATFFDKENRHSFTTVGDSVSEAVCKGALNVNTLEVLTRGKNHT